MKTDRPKKGLPQHERFLGDYLFSEVPAQLLIVGELPPGLVSRPVEGVSVLRFSTLSAAQQHANTHNDVDENSAAGPYVLVLAIDNADANFEQRLGRAVRAFPHRILLHCGPAARLDEQDDAPFYAFGFNKLRMSTGMDEHSEDERWFEYRLSRYKTPPDWLNARFWANPERFATDEDPDLYCDESDEDDDDD